MDGNPNGQTSNALGKAGVRAAITDTACVQEAAGGVTGGAEEHCAGSPAAARASWLEKKTLAQTAVRTRSIALN